MAEVVTCIGEAGNPGELAPDRFAVGAPGDDAGSFVEHPRAIYKDVQRNKDLNFIEILRGCLLLAILRPAVIVNLQQ